jgi:drug/metabolite transporter (DMT)-like permease
MRTLTQALAWPGAPLALTAAALFGASTPLAKLLLGDVAPGLLAGLLYLGAGGALALAGLARRALRLDPPEAPLRRADLPWLAAVVLAGGVLGPLLLMIGLAATPASTAALLLNLEGVLTVGIAWVVLRENVDWRIGLGAGAILAGAALLSWRGGPAGAGLGALAVAGACLCWAVDNTLTRRLSSADPVELVTIKGLVAGAVNVALAWLDGVALPSGGVIAGAMLVGVFGYGISLVCFVRALRHLGAARTGAYFSSAPFVGALIAIPLVGEPVTLTLVAAAALMAVGLAVHLVERHDHAHTHDELVHEHTHRHDAHHDHAHGPDDPAGEPHVHVHRHGRLSHRHAHYPDIHHRHSH